MMIRAYQEILLSNAQSKMGEAFDYAVNTLGLSGKHFISMLTCSSIIKALEIGDPTWLLGKSSIEIVEAVLVETTGKANIQSSDGFIRSSKEYWIGWVSAYYQWYSSRHYNEIFSAIDYESFEEMYYSLHEADISKFTEIADSLVKKAYSDTNLKRYRTIYGCTQSELAALSGVSLRSIQMYEQRNKDINKASVEAVYRLSKSLGCTIEELIER